MDARTTHASRTHSHDARETHSLRGLLAYAAVIPALVALFAAPGIVLAFVLGAVTAVLLDSALGLV
jgi:hypothetical protein